MQTPAPWNCRCRAVVWLTGPPAARPESLPDRRPLCTVAGFVSYIATPVGTYDEVFASVGVLHRGLIRGHVPFMPVDSPDSMAAGRANWSLPKTLGTFTGSPLERIEASGDGWRVAAVAHPRGPRVPAFALAAIVQRFPDGRLRKAGMRFRGRARLATIEVQSTVELIRPGHHLGAVFDEARFRLGRPG
jgi:hypothetical protein